MVNRPQRSRDVSRRSNATNLLNGANTLVINSLAIVTFESRSVKRQNPRLQRQSSPRRLKSPQETRRRPPRPSEAPHPRRDRVDDLQPHRLQPQRTVNPHLKIIRGSSGSQPTFESKVDASDALDGAATPSFPFFAPSNITSERRQLGGRGLRHSPSLQLPYTPINIADGTRR